MAGEDRTSGEEAFQSAEGRFAQPDDVLDRDDLDYATKLDILQRWQAKQRRTGDTPDETSLRRIEQAIHRLQAKVKLNPKKPDGAPSGKDYQPDE